MITGKDKDSIHVLELLQDGTRHKDISAITGVSIDNVKRLSRYNNMLEQASRELKAKEIRKLKELGLNALVLSKLIKASKFDYIRDILTIVDTDIKRSKLQRIANEYLKKARKISNTIIDIKNSIEQLEIKDQELQEKINSLESKNKIFKEKVMSKLGECDDEDVLEFITNHVGLYGDQLVLLKRLYAEWQQRLKGSVIHYDKSLKLWIIEDIVEFKDSLSDRLLNWKKCYWDHQDVPWYMRDYPQPKDPNYKLADHTRIIYKKQVDDLLKQKKLIRKQIRNLKSTSHTFIDKKTVSDGLSNLDIKKHADLENAAMKWLYKKGYAAANEITLPTKKRLDVAGFNTCEEIIIVEAKASMQDFRSDTKWDQYLDYCNKYYFIFDNQDYDKRKVLEHLEATPAGILVFKDGQYRLDKEASQLAMDETNKLLMIYSIGSSAMRNASVPNTEVIL